MVDGQRPVINIDERKRRASHLLGATKTGTHSSNKCGFTTAYFAKKCNEIALGQLAGKIATEPFGLFFTFRDRAPRALFLEHML